MRTRNSCLSVFAGVTLAFVAAGCGSDSASNPNEDNEVFTTVSLTFTPVAGGAPIVASVDDPDGDGGNPPTVTPVILPPGMFDMTVKFENKLEKPTADITLEVRDESSDHQVFYTGTAVNGPASNQPTAPLTHAYNDVDTKGLPLGLANKVTAVAGSGSITVTLRHLPPVNMVAVKSAGLAETVRTTMGFTTIAGSTDVSVTLPVTVQ